MIGAILMKKFAGSSINALNRHDLPKFMKGIAEDCTVSYPGDFSMSGEWKGEKAIEALVTKFMEQFPKVKITIKEIFISNIFALGFTNNVAIEWDVAYTNKEGKEFHNSGVSTARLKRGKIVEFLDYYFNVDLLKEAWGEA